MGESQDIAIYSDMLPATAPPRELPEDMDEGQRGFVTLIEGIYTSMNDPELFGNIIRSFMQELASNSEYDKLLVDADVNAMMRGLRDSMGMARIKKAEKPARGGSKKTPKAAEFTSALDSMDFGDGAFD